MRSRPLFALFVVLFCSAFQSTGFQGCGGSGPPGGTLPPADATGCFSDAECVSTDMCRLMACVAGTCMDQGMRDSDGDGVGPMPCGGDCDDFDGSRFPGATESCNGADEDCDGNIDEDAAPGYATWFLSTSDPSPSIAPLGGNLLVAHADGASGVLQLVGLRGTPITEIPLPGDLRDDLELVSSGTETSLLTMRRSTGTLSLAPVTEPLGLGTSVDIPITADASGLVATGYGTNRIAAVWVEGGSDVRFWSSELAASTSLGTLSESGPLDLASNGALIAVTLPLNRAVFVDPATGMIAAMRALDVGGSWAHAGLTSAGGITYALLRDAFDHRITRFDPMGTLGRQPAPTVMDRTMTGRIDGAGDQLVVTRFSDGTSSISGTTITVMGTDFLPLATYDPSTLGSPGDRASDWDVVVTEDFISVLTTHESNAYGVTLSCGR